MYIYINSMYVYIYIRECVCGRPSVSLNNAKRKVQNRSVKFKKRKKEFLKFECRWGFFKKEKL
jgi:hypothetical protein